MRAKLTSLRTKGLLVAFTLVVNLPVLRSSWSGDDWPNSQAPYWIKWRYGTLTIRRVWDEALYWNDQWMTGVGRFYPLSYIESRFLFTAFQNVFIYKCVQLLVLLSVIALLAGIVKRITGETSYALLCILLLSVAFQLRDDFDPHIGFALMLPSVVLKLLVAEILMYQSAEKSQHWKFAFLGFSFLLILASMSTYEYGLLIAPFVLIPLFFKRIAGSVEGGWPKIRNAIRGIWLQIFTVAAAIFLYLGFVFGYLRPRANSIEGDYVLGVSAKTIPTFLLNLPAGVPLINFKPTDLSSAGAYSVQIAAATLLFLLLFRQTTMSFSGPQILRKHYKPQLDANIGKGAFAPLFSLGILFTLTPALMLSIQETWWTRSRWGHSYLGVFLQEIGFVFLFLAIVTLIHSARRRKNMKTEVVPPSLKYALATVLILSQAHNFAVSDATRGRDFVYNSWNFLLDNRLAFAEARDGDGYISSTSNDAYESNSGVVFSRTGVRLSYLFTANVVWPNIASCPAETCVLKPPLEVMTATLPNVRRNPQDQNEWLNKALPMVASGKQKIWYLDYFPITQNTAFLIEVPFNDPKLDTKIDLGSLNITKISTVDNTYRPLISGKCLSPDFKQNAGKYFVTVYPPNETTMLMDLRNLKLGVC